jgi:parvulin-like peptidyl-prolyl isomerase
MKKILICTALSAILLSGCSFTQNKDAIIKVNDNVITRAQFDNLVDKEIDNSPFKAFGGAGNFVKSDDNVMYLIFKEKVTHELIVKSLLDDEIAKRGIKVTDDDVKSEMKTIIDKVGSKEELNKLLKQQGVSNSEFANDLKTQVRIKKLINSIEKVSVSDADAEKYYKAHPEQFKHGEKVRASHILVSADTLQLIRDFKSKDKDISTEDLNKKVDEALNAQKAKAEAILKQVQANPDNFEQIARKESDDKVSGERGGELGFFAKEEMVPEFSKAAFSMKPNTISEALVKSPYGYHIIKVTDRMEAGTTPFVKAKDEIKFYLETQEQIKVLKNFTDGLMKSAKIEYVDSSFDPKNANKNVNKDAAKNNQSKK